MKKLQKGLVKGERFEDRGRVFVIDEVNPNGSYIAHQITETETEEDLKKSLQRLKVPELKDMAKNLELDDEGKKEELVERIAQALETSDAEGTQTEEEKDAHNDDIDTTEETAEETEKKEEVHTETENEDAEDEK